MEKEVKIPHALEVILIQDNEIGAALSFSFLSRQTSFLFVSVKFTPHCIKDTDLYECVAENIKNYNWLY